MATIPESARAVIESGRLAHLVTLNRDGSPQVTCVWVGIEVEEVVCAHLNLHQKVKNVRRDPRVALSIETNTLNPIGLTEYLVVYGRAQVEEGGAPELLQRLAHVYIGPDVIFPTMENPPPGYIMRITPERFGGVGPWAGPMG
jgi:PPOX class probable F420-dependent enzyme